ncbi:MAG TPA: tRNA preQ1(34) S-adenosylmethionine ribosyltransferase-isomerase QueA [Acidimicrobiales bacterium]|nr:tRNA preQ1(34) S-adenosylmethionine ribosyltransferase-isomerase QueA [Acidimicrobiales bacterium]
MDEERADLLDLAVLGQSFVVPAAPSYELPPSAIAQSPIEPRDAARLLVDDGSAVRHLQVRDLPSLLRPGDVLVVNETRVLPARLHLRKSTGAAVEVLLLEDLGGDEWLALVRPGRRLPPGTVVANDVLSVRVGDVLEGGKRRVWLEADDVPAALASVGEVPLPPYITAGLSDPERYQTVYASTPGSVAAPTAGLHLTPAVLDAVRALGVSVHTVDLHVGLDTFRPVTAERLEDHEVHEEWYSVPSSTWSAVQAARGRGRVVAIGTTTVRALESAAATGSLSGRTRLLITPGHSWGVVDALLTNFHLPCSTLLLLVESFVGVRWRALYSLALDEGYRFLSFGDAMFLERAR